MPPTAGVRRMTMTQRDAEAVEDLGVGAKRVADHFVP